MNIAIAGTGYVGLSLAVLLSQRNRAYAVDGVIWGFASRRHACQTLLAA